MDYIGLHDQGLMDPSIEALWKNIENFDHVFRGIALTVRYVPTNGNSRATFEAKTMRNGVTNGIVNFRENLSSIP